MNYLNKQKTNYSLKTILFSGLLTLGFLGDGFAVRTQDHREIQKNVHIINNKRIQPLKDTYVRKPSSDNTIQKCEISFEKTLKDMGFTEYTRLKDIGSIELSIESKFYDTWYKKEGNKISILPLEKSLFKYQALFDISDQKVMYNKELSKELLKNSRFNVMVAGGRGIIEPSSILELPQYVENLHGNILNWIKDKKQLFDVTKDDHITLNLLTQKELAELGKMLKNSIKNAVSVGPITEKPYNENDDTERNMSIGINIILNNSEVVTIIEDEGCLYIKIRKPNNEEMKNILRYRFKE